MHIAMMKPPPPHLLTDKGWGTRLVTSFAITGLHEQGQLLLVQDRKQYYTYDRGKWLKSLSCIWLKPDMNPGLPKWNLLTCDHPGKHYGGRILQALGTDSALLPLSLWDHSPCRSRALPLWSVSIFLTDEFAHYICEAICDSVGTAPVSYPLQCVVLLLAHRNIRFLSLILTCHRFDWTISRPLETGVAWLKTMGYSDLYQIQLFHKMINMFKTVPHWGENRTAIFDRKPGVAFCFSTDIFQTCLLFVFSLHIAVPSFHGEKA